MKTVPAFLRTFGFGLDRIRQSQVEQAIPPQCGRKEPPCGYLAGTAVRSARPEGVRTPDASAHWSWRRWRHAWSRAWARPIYVRLRTAESVVSTSLSSFSKLADSRA